MRFDYVKYNEESQKKQQELKQAFEVVEGLVDQLYSSRAKSLIYTKLEEAYMWCGKAIRDHQIGQEGVSPEQVERSNS